MSGRRRHSSGYGTPRIMRLTVGAQGTVCGDHVSLVLAPRNWLEISASSEMCPRGRKPRAASSTATLSVLQWLRSVDPDDGLCC